jgi:hypothetical protein
VTGAIVIFLVTGRMVYDWKIRTNQVQEVASSVEQLTEKLTKNSKEDGYEASI